MNTKDNVPDTTNPKILANRARMPRRDVQPPLEARRDPLALEAWHAEQQRIEEERARAWSEYPPGTKMFVSTARGIPRRGRAGVVFSDKGRTEILVVNADDDMIAKVRAAQVTRDADLEKIADEHRLTVEDVVALRNGGAVGPLGAKAIADDSGLNVHTSSSAKEDASSEDVEALRAENATLKEQLAKANQTIDALRKPKSSPDTGAPSRLAKGTDAKSEDFGGADDKSKAKG